MHRDLGFRLQDKRFPVSGGLIIISPLGKGASEAEVTGVEVSSEHAQVFSCTPMVLPEGRSRSGFGIAVGPILRTWQGSGLAAKGLGKI